MEKINIKNLNDYSFLEINFGDEVFAIQDDNGCFVAFSIISNSNKNIIRFYVPEKYRNNSYGNQIFCESLKYLKNMGIKEFYLYCPEDNYIARKILKKNGGHLDAIKKGLVNYYFSL